MPKPSRRRARTTSNRLISILKTDAPFYRFFSGLAGSGGTEPALSEAVLLDWVETILVYKLPRASREEIRRRLESGVTRRARHSLVEK